LSSSAGFLILEPMEESTPKKQKTIRLTKTEAYAMQMERPKKKKLTFFLVGGLIAAALGTVLWIFQDAWLPYWFPTAEESGPVIEEVVSEGESPSPTESVTPPAAAALIIPLDFLSAATWDHPRFRQGVRLFNQALDRYHLFLASPQDMDLLAQVAEGTRQAGRVFQSLKPVEPSSAPLDHALDQCRRLLAAVQESRQKSASVKAPPTAPRPSPPRIQAGEIEQHPEFQKGAGLFNQALDQFNQYKAQTTRKELLKPTEDLARQAAQTFEALKRQTPEQIHDEIDRYIHQCYGIVSACRQQQLEAEGAKSAVSGTFNRGTAGPSRRQALPAYQPPK